MTMRDTADTRLWLRNQHENPTQSWLRLCLSLTRQARGLDGKYATAYAAWVAAEHKHPLTVDVDWHTVPRGAPIFYRGHVGGDGIQYGHIVTFIGVTQVGPLCWTNDAIAAGKVNLVSPLWFISHWGHELLGWAGDLEGVDLPLDPPGPPPPPPHAVSIRQVIAAAKSNPDQGQGAKTPGAGYDVIRVENALVDLGYLSESLADGSYGTATITAYAKWQRLLGYSGDAANGIPGPVSLRRLGAKYEFRVVA